MNIKNLRIVTKLSLLAGSFVVGLLTLGILAYSALNTLKVGGTKYTSVMSVKNLIADILPPPLNMVEIDGVLHRLLVEPSENSADLLQNFNELKTGYQESYSRWTKDLPEGQMKIRLVELNKLTVVYLDTAENALIPAVKSHNLRKAARVLAELRREYEGIKRISDEIVRLAVNEDERNANEVVVLAQSETLRLLATAFAVILLCCAFAWWISRSIANPLSRLVSIAGKIAAGDLREDIPYVSEDEIGKLAASYQRLTSVRLKFS